MKKRCILLVLLASLLLTTACVAVEPEATQPSVAQFCDEVDPSRLQLDLEGLP